MDLGADREPSTNKASVSYPQVYFEKPCFKIDYAYAGSYTLKVVPAFNVLVKNAFLK